MGKVLKLTRRKNRRPASPSVRRHSKTRRSHAPWYPLALLVVVAAAAWVFLEAGEAGGTGDNRIVGRASVIDGDTLDVAGARIRLFGIDAPEASQQCRDETGILFACGEAATHALRELIRNQTVSCDRRDVDPFGRIASVCTADGVDLNGALVDAGMAVAYRQFSWRYVANEYRARWNDRGLWQGEFEMPWDYRR